MPSAPDPEALLAHDPFVRALARAILTDEHAVDDVVQQTWLGALRANAPPGAMRAWLAAIARNAARDRLRRGGARARFERQGLRDEAVPSMQAILEREEARREVIAALEAIPGLYRDALLLKYFEDLTPRAMAQRLGVNAETARTRVKRGLELLRAELARRRGGAGPAASALLPLAGWHLSFPSTPVLTMAAMTAKTKTAVALTAVLLTALGLWWALPTPSWTDHNAHDPGITIAELPAAAMEPLTPPPASSPEPFTSLIREAAESRTGVASAPDADFGSLLVRVVWHDKTPAAGMGISWFPSSDRNGFHYAKRFTTDSEGCFRVAKAPVGKVVICPDRSWWRITDIMASKESEFLITIPEGMDLDGKVVNTRGEPVDGAAIHLWDFDRTGDELVAARSDSKGEFKIRQVEPQYFWAYATKEGFACSGAKWVNGAKGSTVSLTLELGGPGNEVRGRVRDVDGNPVEGAAVFISDGAERGRAVPARDGVIALPARPPRGETGVKGEFVVKYLSKSQSPVVVRALGFALWRGTVNMESTSATTLDIVLRKEVILEGTVKDRSGAVPKNAQVDIGVHARPDHFDAYPSKLDGSFRITGLPEGPILVNVLADGEGQASAQLQGVAGQVVRWDAVLDSGGTLKGRVVDERGSPYVGFSVYAQRQEYDGRSVLQGGQSRTDSKGEFTIVSCPPDAMSVRVTTPIPGEFTVKRLSRVRIADGPLTIVLPEGLEQNARVKGIISDTAGNPLPSAEVRIRRVGDSAVGGASVNADGSFESVKLIAGSYWVQVKVPNVGSWNSPVHHVNRGEVWDLGSIRVPKAGMLILVVHPLGNLTKGAHSIVLRGDEPHIVEPLRFEFAGTESPPQPVAPGHYTLAVHCYDQTQDIADVRIEVDIRSGEETRLDIHLRAGGRRLFLFTLPKDVKLVEGDGERLQLIVRGESGSVELVTSGTLWEEKATIAARGTFVPGKYRLEALTSGGLKASGEFTVNGPSSQEETITTVLSR